MMGRHLRLVLIAAALALAAALTFIGGCDCGEKGAQDASTGDGGGSADGAGGDGAVNGDGGDASTGDGGDGGQPGCLYHPVGDFAPKLYGEWRQSPVLPALKEVIALPTVMNMTDDNGDGQVDQHDVPDMAFISFQYDPIDPTTFYEGGVLRVISGDPTLAELCTNADVRLAPESGISGYIDKYGVPTIIAALPNRDTGTGLLKPSKLVQFHIVKDGAGYKCEKGWESQIEVDVGWGSASVADINGDGTPEIVAGETVFKEDGSLMWKGSGGNGGRSGDPKTWYPGAISAVADVDMDGKPEIVAGNTVYRDLDGSHYKVVWKRDGTHKDGALNDGLVAIADMNGDGKPEVVLVNTKQVQSGTKFYRLGQIYVLEGATGNTICGPAELPYNTPLGSSSQGGAPMLADFDGDGSREIGVAGAEYLAVFSKDCALKWKSPTKDVSSNVTGSSVFDFEGDGPAEAVYNDEVKLRIYKGKTGDVIKELDNTTWTTFEYPIIADVNNDNKAEIVVVANTICSPPADPACNYPKQNGIRIFTDSNNNWVSTRKIWNQHTYHVTNVCSGEEDGYCDKDENKYGRIPKIEKNGWAFSELNNYRQNVQGPGGFAAPDFIPAAVVPLRKRCPDSLGLLVTVRNIGDAPAGGKEDIPDGGAGDSGVAHLGIPVALYRGNPDAGNAKFLAVGYTDRRMAPHGGEAKAEVWWYNAGVTWPIDDLFIVVNDDGMGGRAYNECDYTNNMKALGLTDCIPEG